MYSCWRPRRSDSSAAADVTVITPHLHITELPCDWTAAGSPQRSPPRFKPKSRPPRHRLSRRGPGPRSAPRSCRLNRASGRKVCLLTECIRWPRPGPEPIGRGFTFAHGAETLLDANTAEPGRAALRGGSTPTSGDRPRHVPPRGGSSLGPLTDRSPTSPTASTETQWSS